MLCSRAKHISVTAAPYMKEYNVNKQTTKAPWKVLKVTCIIYITIRMRRGGGGGTGGGEGGSGEERGGKRG